MIVPGLVEDYTYILDVFSDLLEMYIFWEVMKKNK
jgi:hypothetical protein